MSNVWIYGRSGRMGKVLENCLSDSSHWQLSGGTDSRGDHDVQGRPLALRDAHADVIIDFSSPAGNSALHAALLKEQLRDTSVLIATTGLSSHALAAWDALAKAQELRVLCAPNTSIGITLMVNAALSIMQACGDEFDIEISEAHHRGKQDSPSGTALHLAARLCTQDSRYSLTTQRQGPRQKHEIGISALRGGKIYGEHRVAFLGDDEEITISHRALTRELFAKGALRLAAWLRQRQSGFYTLGGVQL